MQTLQIQSWDRLRMLESAERVGKLGGWSWIPESDQLLWSDNLYRIFGLEPGEIALTPEGVIAQIHPDDRAGAATYFELCRRMSEPPPFEYRINLPGLGVRYLRTTVTTMQSDDRGAARIAGAVQDVTDQLLADREIAVHVAVSKVVAGWGGFIESSERLLCQVADALGCVFGAMWLPDGDLLAARFAHSDSAFDLSEFTAATFALRIPRGVGFLGEVWERRTPVCVVDVVGDREYRRYRPAVRAGVHGAVAFPAVHGGEVLAVLEFYFREEVSTDALTKTMSAIGSDIGECLGRRRGQLLSSSLTRRELQVLQLAANGCSRSQIADQLTVSATTIATHMKHISERLGVRGRTSAVAIGIRYGLIE